MDLELLRQSYLPEKIDILLLGESPPKKGRFFYDTCAMTTFTSRAFEKVFDTHFQNNTEFLTFFKNKNCFLDDVCHYPIDHLEKAAREIELSNNISKLSARIKHWNPQVVCVVLKKIEEHVRNAVSLSGRQPSIYVLPFPGNGHQNKYISGLTDVLKEVAEH